jgi:hypothetical protein
MSYVVHIWQSPTPRDSQHAWEIVERLSEERGAGGPPPALVQLVERITARYPNWADLPDDQLDDEHIVWVDGRVQARGPLLVLGICSGWIERVQPFVVEEANRLGLVCFDMQLGKLYLPS